jgi:hypothetical protein
MILFSRRKAMISKSPKVSYNSSMTITANHKKVLYFICVAAVITVIFGIIYAAVQQSIRQAANDPQISMAEDAANALANGTVPASLMPADRHVIDASESLFPFIMVFDENGTVLESSMKVGDTLPVPPKGVFDFTRSNGGASASGPSSILYDLKTAHSSNIRPAGEDRFTWQTATGLRFATIVVHFNASSSAPLSTNSSIVPASGGAISSGFVLAARSLREIENRESQLALSVLMGWFASIIILLGGFIVKFWMPRS